ncbi:MAG: AbrB/MazE/SpoVT family DNA-binding domain-containing protein [Candidatus Bathyarchaeota archaeon]|nr:MAG: AbrB/MazE/SpoVT family DNA-binding domain-containing protein [Candidatus Bathyarchaeota archaeon]
MNRKRINSIELLDNLYKSKLDDRGRIYIPKSVRERLSIKLGDTIYIKSNEESFSVFTRRAMKKQLTK